MIRPLPVLLPPLTDELLSSWLGRHATFYRVSGVRLLRHCGVDAGSMRSIDLALSAHDQRQIARTFRTDPQALRRMTQSRGRRRPAGLIATDRPMQVCRRCVIRHDATPETRGARLRSWMEGWRVSCPVCGARLDDCRPMNMLNRANPADPLLARVAEHAAEGEMILEEAVRRNPQDGSAITLMRSLLLPRAHPWQASPTADIPRLLNVVITGFDDFLRDTSPGFRRPGTLLLPMSVRIPVLAGVARVVRRPSHWTERLLPAVGDSARPALAGCLRALGES